MAALGGAGSLSGQGITGQQSTAENLGEAGGGGSGLQTTSAWEERTPESIEDNTNSLFANVKFGPDLLQAQHAAFFSDDETEPSSVLQPPSGPTNLPAPTSLPGTSARISDSLSSRSTVFKNGPKFQGSGFDQFVPQSATELALRLQDANDELRRENRELRQNQEQLRSELATARQSLEQKMELLETTSGHLRAAQAESDSWKTRFQQLGESIQAANTRRSRRIDEIASAIDVLEQTLHDSSPPDGNSADRPVNKEPANAPALNPPITPGGGS